MEETKHPAQSGVCLQASTSGSNQHYSGSGNGRQKQHLEQQKQSEQQQTQWDFRVMTYNILAEGLVSCLPCLPATFVTTRHGIITVKVLALYICVY